MDARFTFIDVQGRYWETRIDLAARAIQGLWPKLDGENIDPQLRLFQGGRCEPPAFRANRPIGRIETFSIVLAMRDTDNLRYLGRYRQLQDSQIT